MSDQETYAVIKQAVIEALGVGEDEVQPDTTLMDELGAESIDLLDILFRIERKLGVKIKAADVAAYVQGDVPEGGFGDDDGIVSAAGLAQIHKIMPQVDLSKIEGKLESEKVMTLFSVQNLADMVTARAALTA